MTSLEIVMTSTPPDIDPMLAPLFDTFPLAEKSIKALAAEIRRLYPPIPTIQRIAVVDPSAQREICNLVAGTSLRQRDLPAGATIAVIVSAPCTIAFEFDGKIVRQESNPPYSIAGDSTGGRLNPWDGLRPGEHTLRVTPFDKPNGRAGKTVVITFAIVAETTIPSDAGSPPQEIVVPPQAPHEAAGFSAFPLADRARQIHVRADGDDGNAGDSPGRPLRTLARAMSLLRPAGGDRILLYAGHQFAGPVAPWRVSGIPGKPAGIFAYDDGSPDTLGKRPIISCRDANAIDIDSPGVHDVAFVGLHLTAADREPADAGFRIASKSNYGIQALFPTRSVTIEDCRIDHFAFNVSFVCAGNKGQHENVVLRRCLLLDAWGPPTELYRGQGIYLERCKGVRIVECVLDHNGWVENAPGVKPVRNIYRHGAYLNEAGVEDVVFEANIASRNANFGVQLRSGGIVRRCVFFDNATSVGVGGETADVTDNLIVGGHHTDQYGQSIAVEIFSRGAVISRNVMLGTAKQSHRYPAARIHVSRRPWTPAGDRTCRIEANAMWGCEGQALSVGDALAELTVAGNDFQDVGRQIVALDKPVARCAFSANRYGGANGVTFTHHSAKDKPLTQKEWAAITGDSSAPDASPPPQSDWRFDEAFIARSRARERGEWSGSHDPAHLVRSAREVLK